MSPTTVRVEVSTAVAKEVALRHLGPLVIDTTRRVANRAKILCPVDTGNLRASITQKISLTDKEIVGRVGTNVKYALFVHDGTRPHRISANDAKSLVFFWPAVGTLTVVPKKATGWNGYYAKKTRFMIGKGYVNHPGTKGRPFLRTALFEEGMTAGFVVKSI